MALHSDTRPTEQINAFKRFKGATSVTAPDGTTISTTGEPAILDIRVMVSDVSTFDSNMLMTSVVTTGLPNMKT